MINNYPTVDSYHLDLEGRSAADLKKVGAYRYSEDPSTRIFMAGVSKNDGPVYLWVNPEFESDGLRSDPRADQLLLEMAADPTCLVYAWNAQFERAMLRSRMETDMGLPAPAAKQFRCVQAMSRRAAMPPKLETAAETLSMVEKKDKKGGALITYFCKPTKDGSFRDPRDPKHQEKFAEFGRYCVQDVVTEKGLHKKLQVFEMKGEVLRTFLLDAQINDAGLPVNVKALEKARVILDEVFGELNDKFYRLTGLMQSQNKAVKGLLQSLGVEVGEEEIENLQAETVTAAILAQEMLLEEVGREGDADTVAFVENNLEILRTYSALNYAAAKKVYAMLACVCSDGRVRGTLVFHGAHTGRWTGRLVQPQNFKKPSKHLEMVTDLAYQAICDGWSRRDLEGAFGNPLEVIASCIRHFIQWDGGEMLDADYNAIEARIVCWLAGQENVLATFRASDTWTGPKELKPDLYKDMAAQIYEKHAKEINKAERTVGKHTILGCGFAMWWPKFIETCAKFGVTVSEELAQKAVKAYRVMCDKVVQLWEDVENAAKAAIRSPGKVFWGGTKLKFCVATSEGVPYLVMTLPSKRNIVYPWPKIETVRYQAKDEKGELLFTEVHVNGVLTHREPVMRTRQSITFFGQIEGKAFYGRIKTYGGKLVENATQGVAADVMACGAANAMEWGFEVPTLIHDQALGLKHPGHEIEDFVLALTTLPDWADGLPIVAEGDVVPYYTKAA